MKTNNIRKIKILMLQRLHPTNRLGQWESESGVKSVHWGGKNKSRNTQTKGSIFTCGETEEWKEDLFWGWSDPSYTSNHNKSPRRQAENVCLSQKAWSSKEAAAFTRTWTNTHKPTRPAHSQHRISALTQGKYSSNPPGRLMAHTLTHDDALIFIFSPPPLSLSSGSAGRIEGAVWRNPLSRHFSFPLTDRPWRARAFGPPAWLAARQLNKPSSCYNSLKHFQLPESNKSSRRALGCFSTSNPTPEQVLLRLSFRFICRLLRWRGRGFFFLDKRKQEVSEENWGVQTAGYPQRGRWF